MREGCHVAPVEPKVGFANGVAQQDSSTPLCETCPERSRGSRNDEGGDSSTPLRFGRNDEAAVRKKGLSGGAAAAQPPTPTTVPSFRPSARGTSGRVEKSLMLTGLRVGARNDVI
ncbi:MAG: hypothetical protein LBK47_04780 [Prevotellaceae bacterium]|nr:hypothetical protein [Prevotellaceae bacterium]